MVRSLLSVVGLFVSLLVSSVSATTISGQITSGSNRLFSVVVTGGGFTVTTDANGIFALPSVSATTCVVTCSKDGYVTITQNSNTFLEMLKVQTISFTHSQLDSKNYGDEVSLSATASSGLPVTYVSLDPSVVTIAGSTAKMIGTGSARVVAKQVGGVNGDKYAAVYDTATFTVSKRTLTLSGLSIADKVYDASASATSATVSSVGNLQNVVGSDDVSPSITSSTFSNANVGSGKTVTVSVSLTGSKAGNYLFSSPITSTASITKATASVVLSDLVHTSNGSAKSATATTTPSGLTVGITYDGSSTAPSAVGSYTVVATINETNYQGSVTSVMTINAPGKTDQTITLTSEAVFSTSKAFVPAYLRDVGYPDTGTYQLSASATSGLSVTYSSSNTSVASIDVNKLTIEGVGTTTITASVAGNGTYYPATITRTFTVVKATLGVFFNSDDLTQTYNGSSKDLDVSSSVWAQNGVTNDDISVTYNGSSTPPTNAGSYTVIGTINRTEYQGSAEVTLTISKASQTVTFTSISNKTYGDAAFDLSASASTGLPVTFESSDNTVATINGTQVTLVGAGSVTITASQSGNANYNAATATRSFTVSKASQSITFNSLSAKTIGDADFPLTGSASSMPVSYASSNTSVATVSGSIVTLVGAGSTDITASQAGNSNYNAASNVVRTLVVNKATATVTLSNLSATYDGSAKSATATTTPSGLTVNLTYDGSSTAPTNAGSYAVVGTISDAAYQGSNSGTLVIGKASQSISFGALSAKTYNDGQFNLTATVGSGLSVSYSSSNTSVATISGSTVTIVGAGSTNITASQGGNSNYSAASDVAQSLTVNKATATVTLSNLTHTYNGSSKSATATTTPSGLTVGIVYNPTNPTAAGSYAVTATISDANYQGSASGTLIINTPAKVDQTITFAALSDKVFGSGNFDLSASALGGTVTFSSSNTSVATVSGSTVTIVGVGITTISANQAGDATYNAAPTVDRTLTITKASQTITFNALSSKVLGDAAFTLSASASSSLPVAYTSSNTSVATVSGSTVTIVGVGATNITASQAGNGSYNAAADVVQSLTVSAATGTVTLSNLSQTYDGNTKAATAVTNPAGLPVTTTYNGSATVPTNAGTYAVVATINDASYQGSASGNLVIAKAAQTFTVTIPSTKVVGGAPTALTATSSAGLPISYTSSDTTVVKFAGDTIKIVGPGTVTVTASQSGNANYNAAETIQGTVLVVGKPVFTSADTASVRGGTVFAYKVSYLFPGNPPAFKDTVLSKPSWINVQGDSVWGTVPNVNRNDTVKVMVGTADVSDTLVLVIRITSQTTGLVNGKLAVRDCFGVRLSNHMIQFGANAGAYEISIFNMAGQAVFHQRAEGTAGFVKMVQMKTSMAYIVRLKQGERSLTQKFQILR